MEVSPLASGFAPAPDFCSTVFRLPLELFLEIFSYLTDHRCFIRENYYGRDTRVNVRRGVAARSITIRRLTMTCWPLRNLLLPLLWVDVEGFIAHFYYDPDTRQGGEGSHLYAQCVYLRLNPEIATYVRYVRFPPILLPLTNNIPTQGHFRQFAYLGVPS